MKRDRSPGAVGEGSSRAKQSKISCGSTATRPHRELRIDVYLRSKTKASTTNWQLNDPKPTFLEQWQRDDFSPDLADGQHTAQHGSPERPAPTAHPGQQSREGSLDGSNQDDDSALDYDSDISDEDGEEFFQPPWAWETDSDTEEYAWYEDLYSFASLKHSTDMPTASRRAAGKERNIEVGSCHAELIRRDEIRNSFRNNMLTPSGETSDLACDLFDRYGRLNPNFYENDDNKGTGVWGNELDRGDLLLFSEVTVDAAHRRCGVGTKLVKAILEKTRKKVSERVGFFALVRPSSRFPFPDANHFNPAPLEDAGAADMKASLGFWHALGFRRVGISSWFAWTDSPGHPSRQLGIAQDWIRPDDPTTEVLLSGEMLKALQRLWDPAVEAAACIDELTEAFPDDFEDAKWQKTDIFGKTMLHFAAMARKPELVNFIVSRVPCLMAVRDMTGRTALEALKNELECLRGLEYNGVVTTCNLGKPEEAFRGFSDSEFKCLAILEHTTIPDPSSISPRHVEALSVTDEQIEGWARIEGWAHVQPEIDGIRQALRYKYGCTCGQCMGGFLSPRMRFALLCVAEVEHNKMKASINGKTRPWIQRNIHLLKNISSLVVEGITENKSYRVGFANMFSHFAKVLQQGNIPKERRVLDLYEYEVGKSRHVTLSYLVREEIVAAAACAIFERAMKQDELTGDGYHRDVFGEDIDKLVACRNDHEFGWVAGMCGYKEDWIIMRRLACSPYRSGSMFGIGST